jgi:hypothetical protein
VQHYLNEATERLIVEQQGFQHGCVDASDARARYVQSPDRHLDLVSVRGSTLIFPHLRVMLWDAAKHRLIIPLFTVWL